MLVERGWNLTKRGATTNDRRDRHRYGDAASDKRYGYGREERIRQTTINRTTAARLVGESGTGGSGGGSACGEWRRRRQYARRRYYDYDRWGGGSASSSPMMIRLGQTLSSIFYGISLSREDREGERGSGFESSRGVGRRPAAARRPSTMVAVAYRIQTNPNTTIYYYYYNIIIIIERAAERGRSAASTGDHGCILLHRDDIDILHCKRGGAPLEIPHKSLPQKLILAHMGAKIGFCGIWPRDLDAGFWVIERVIFTLGHSP